jgi:hypothetical protein
MSEHHKAGMAAMQKAEGGAEPAPGGAPSPGGAAAPMGMAMAQGGQQPASGGAPAPAQQHGADDSPEAIDAHIQAIQGAADKYPELQELADKHISQLKDKRDSLEKHQDFQIRQQEWQQNQQRMEQNTQTMQQLRAQGLEDSKEARAASLQMRQAEVEGRQQLAQITLGMKQSQDHEQVQQHAQMALANLTTRAKALSASPVDQAKLQLPAFNAQVKALKKQLKDSGMPEIADTLTPLKIGEEPGKLWGTNPAIVEDTGDSAEAPVASKSGKKMVKDPKSPSGWSYAD